jgi:hypothetical protein
VSQLSAAPSPVTTAEALEMLTSAMSYLAAADPTQLTASEQARCLQRLEQADAIETAARAKVLGAFTAGQGYAEDADSPLRPRVVAGYQGSLARLESKETAGRVPAGVAGHVPPPPAL